MEVNAAALLAAARSIADLVKSHARATNVVSEDFITLPEALHDHLREVANWSAQTQFYGMAFPESTEQSTVELSFDVPRRFRPAGQEKGSAPESALLDSPYHCVLLGDPGSGKTTTLKRIAARLITSGPEGVSDVYQYPVVIRLRELRQGTTLIDALATRIGIGAPTEHASLANIPSGRRMARNIPVSFDLQRTVEAFLDGTGALLLLDGIDEMDPETQRRMIADIRTLALHLSKSKIILTCRSGGYWWETEGWKVLEICPLEKHQIAHIANKWLGSKADGFLCALAAVPYHDVANRPLLIAQMMVIFRIYNRLPEQPAEVYRKLIRLLLEDWDHQRGVTRVSKYGRFESEDKARFLAALAYELTYRVRSINFSTEDLVRAYAAIRGAFGLPAAEAEQVATELESHSGIIVAASAGYEFSHLSIQEYLCGEFLVKAPFPEALPRYAAEYPSPLAVAVALSSDPTGWLAGLFFYRGASLFSDKSISAFVHRLNVEKPRFQPSPLFGFVLMSWALSYPNSGVCDLMNSETATESLQLALPYFHYLSTTEGHGSEDRAKFVRSGKPFRSEYGFKPPLQGAIPLDVLDVLFSRGALVYCRDRTGEYIARHVKELNSGPLKEAKP